jgi:hypothetical protein
MSERWPNFRAGRQRSAPVLGHRNVKVDTAAEKCDHARAALVCCARRRRLHVNLETPSVHPVVRQVKRRFAFLRCCARGRGTLHESSTVASVRFLRAAANPGRGDLSIDRPPPYQPNPFCFSAARRLSCVHDSSLGLRRAAEKQKGRCYLGVSSINRPPLTGFGHRKAAEGSVESGLFLSAFCTSHAAYKVQRGLAHSALAGALTWK